MYAVLAQTLGRNLHIRSFVSAVSYNLNIPLSKHWVTFSWYDIPKLSGYVSASGVVGTSKKTQSTAPKVGTQFTLSCFRNVVSWLGFNTTLVVDFKALNSLNIKDMVWVEANIDTFEHIAARARFNKLEMRLLIYTLAYFNTTRDIKPFMRCIARTVKSSPFWSHRRLIMFIWGLLIHEIHNLPSNS